MNELGAQRFILLVVLALVGLLTFRIAGSIFAFLPLFVALLLTIRGRAAQLIVGALAVGLLISIVVAMVSESTSKAQAVAWASFFTIVLATVAAVSQVRSAETLGPAGVLRRLAVSTASDVSQNGQAEPSTSIEIVHEEDRKSAAFASARAFWTGVTQVMSFRLLQEDGSYRWTEVRAEPPVPSGVKVDPLVTGKDLPFVSEPIGPLASQVDAVSAAKTIENLFGNGWAFDANGRWIYLPRFAQTTLGYTPDELNVSCDEGFVAWKLLLHPDEYEAVADNWLRCLKTGMAFNAEFRIRRRTGYAWARSSARPVHDSAGKIVGWYGTSIDIDVHRKTVEVLHERERELLELVNVVPSNVWRLARDGEPNFFNTRMADYLGLTVDEVVRPGLSKLDAMIEMAVHPDDRASFKADLGHSLETGEGFASRYRLRRFDGTYRWMSSRAEALRGRDGEIVQWYGLCHDINDQVDIEEALQRSEWHLHQLIDALPVRVCSWTPAGDLSYVSKRYLEELGLSTATFQEMSAAATALVHPDDAALVHERASEAIRKGEIFVMRYRRCGLDGVYRWTDGRFEPLRNAEGKITEWYGLSIDVDDEMRIQQSLRASEQSLQQLVETLPALIYCATPEGKPIYRSKKLREFLGFGLEEKDSTEKTRLEGTLEAIIHPDDLPVVQERYGHSLATGEPYVLKHRLRRFDGTYRWVETRTAAMRDESGAIVQWNGVCLDIDDWMKSQEELGLAQRNLARASEAASLAELTASIAHEVGQPLAALVSSSDACQQWLSADPPNIERAQRALERVVRSAGTATEVVTRIRALFKHNNDARSLTSIAGVLAEARDLMSEEVIRRNVRVEVDIERDLPAVHIDRVQIQQVLVNLVRNALDALESVSGHRTLKVRACLRGNAIQIGLSDNGPGIEAPDRIFEPFFTTKGQGMGMGLAICRSIVESHGGQLWAEKAEPHGATFVFTLPFDYAAAV